MLSGQEGDNFVPYLLPATATTAVAYPGDLKLSF
jgi:hypothetical protein